MKRKIRERCLAGTITLLLFLTAGCTTVVRENIISSVNTGIGVSLAENPKTEMYEAKIGYIRSQFYSVPTGKTVEGTTSNAADVTPELVSGIKMNSDARHLFLGITVAENFAVGKVAVMSPAAVAMYVADAKTATNASAASQAVSAVAETKEFTEFRRNQTAQKNSLDEIRQKYKAANDDDKKKIVEKAATLEIMRKDTAPDKFLKTLNFFADGTTEHTEKLDELLKAIKNP